ncbi:hypothetical protein KJ841_01625 [Patescibacteria group bacterium]|nr:hypothetical protein [Patescibacteria group bacterium]
MNKAISTPIAIIIIVLLAILVGGITAWQYGLFPEISYQKIHFPKSEIILEELEDKTLEDKSNVKSIIEDRTIETMTAIKDKDEEKLSSLAHPNKGVRFSPYTYVILEDDLVFSADELSNFFEDENIYTWGTYDGSGFPIDLTPSEYYDKIIYTADFLNAEQISYNRIIGKGNTINNTFEVYPDSIIVEYYFSGFDLNLEGFDWRSLRLVFEEKDNVWYLVGIINDHWTI